MNSKFPFWSYRIYTIASSPGLMRLTALRRSCDRHQANAHLIEGKCGLYCLRHCYGRHPANVHFIDGKCWLTGFVCLRYSYGGHQPNTHLIDGNAGFAASRHSYGRHPANVHLIQEKCKLFLVMVGTKLMFTLIDEKCRLCCLET